MTAKAIELFEDGEANFRAAACLSALWLKGEDLLEGTLERVDEWVSEQLLEALWAASQGEQGIPAHINIPGDINQLPADQLQDYAAKVFLKAAGQEHGCHGAFVSLGADACTDFAMRIEEWRDRYQPEDDFEL